MATAMEQYAIGLDLGTSSVKAVLFSKDTGVAARIQEAGGQTGSITAAMGL